MRVVMMYFAQVRQAAGLESETVEVASGARVTETLTAATALHGEGFRALVLDEQGCIRPSLLVLVNGVPVSREARTPLRDGDTISLLSAVAGG